MNFLWLNERVRLAENAIHLQHYATFRDGVQMLIAYSNGSYKYGMDRVQKLEQWQKITVLWIPPSLLVV